VEKYKRDINVKRVLTTMDTNDDGIDDTIAYLNKEDLFLPVLLKQSIKDLGVYTDHKEESETIDLGSFWDPSNDGFGDGGVGTTGGGLGNPYSGDTESEVVDSDLETIGCMDANALNYNPLATEACAGCCDDGFGGVDSTSGEDNTDTGTGGDGGCFKLNSYDGFGGQGCILNNNLPSWNVMANRAQQFCSSQFSSPRTDECGDVVPAGSYELVTRDGSGDYITSYTIGCNCGNTDAIIAYSQFVNGSIPYQDTTNACLYQAATDDNGAIYQKIRYWKFRCG
jgi:hypothetical protein